MSISSLFIVSCSAVLFPKSYIHAGEFHTFSITIIYFFNIKLWMSEISTKLAPTCAAKPLCAFGRITLSVMSCHVKVNVLTGHEGITRDACPLDIFSVAVVLRGGLFFS